MFAEFYNPLELAPYIAALLVCALVLYKLMQFSVTLIYKASFIGTLTETIAADCLNTAKDHHDSDAKMLPKHLADIKQLVHSRFSYQGLFNLFDRVGILEER